MQEVMQLGLIPLRITFRLTWEEIPITGFYKLDGSAAGKFPFHGEGSFFAIPKNVTLDGRLLISTPPSGFLNMTTFDAILTFEDFHSNFDNLISESEITQEYLNRVLERLVLEMVVLGQETISMTMSNMVIPLANSFLNTMTTEDLLDLIAGGGRGGGGGN